jgi:hypothetical protein
MTTFSTSRNVGRFGMVFFNTLAFVAIPVLMLAHAL